MNADKSRKPSPSRSSHSRLCFPGILGTFNAFVFCFQDALSYPAADFARAIGRTIPWRPMIWTSVLISVVTSTFVLIAIRFAMPRPHTRQVRTAQLWNAWGIALQAPPLFGIALFFLIMAAGGLDHFRD